MRIAVDVRELCGHPTGVGRYLSGLFDAWTGNADARRHEWRLYAHAPAALTGAWREHLRVLPGAAGTAWEQFTLPAALRRERPDVLFAPGYTAPLTVAAPIVLTVHDVSFFAHPEWFAFREGLRRRQLTAWSARRARRILTVSEFSKGEIVRRIGVDAARVHAIPHGIAAAAAPAADPRSPREPLVLFVGSIFERRRVDRLIEAFDQVAAAVPAATLEIVGENRTRRPRLDVEAIRRRQTHADRIHLRSYVDDETLAALYRRASVFAFLSEYEGFGFTPLEALAAGAAPVLLDTPIARETCGPAARYVSPDAPTAAVAETITALLTSGDAHAEVMRHRTAVLSRYDWDVTAADTLTVLEDAARGR